MNIQSCLALISGLQALLVLVPLAASAAAAAQRDRPLFTPAVENPDRPPRHHGSLMRSRSVRVDPAVLHEIKGGSTNHLVLQLFDGIRVSGSVDRREAHAPAKFSFAGRLAEDDLGEFSFVINHDALVGLVRLPRRGQLYRISDVGQSGQLLQQIDADKLGECAGEQPAPVAPAQPLPGAMEAAAADAAGDPPACGDDPSLIDVMVLYTDVARAAAGGSAAIEAEAQMAVDIANQTYANSRIRPRLRLVHVAEVSYNESGTFSEHLDRLTGRSDGYFDHIHTLRNQYGADMVSLLVDDSAYCGKAWVCSDGGNAFSVVNWNCASSNYSFAHELGHNMGCQHDRETAAGAVGCDNWAYGWRFTGDSGRQWRTVMAYEPGTRIGHFSNPDVYYDGERTGSSILAANAANNVFTINERADKVASWRLHDIWVDFAWGWPLEIGCYVAPFNTLAEGLNAVPIGGRLFLKAGSRRETVTTTKAMSIHAYDGPVTIGR